MIVRELIALFGFKVDKKTEQGVSSTFSKLSKAAGVLAAVFVTGRIAKGINDVVVGTAALGDSVDKVSRKLGVNSDALQELRFAAEQTGVATQQFDVGLQRFIRRSAEAANGTGEAKDALKELGVQLRDSEGNLRAPEELLGDVAEGLKNTGNQSDRVRLAFKLFDTEGVNLVNTLSSGRDALESMRVRARELGGVLDKDLIRLSAEFTDQQNEMSKSLQGLRNIIAKVLLPVWIGFVDATRDMAKTLREPLARGLKVVREIFRGLGNILRTIAIGWKSVADLVAFAADEFLGVNQRITQVIIGLTLLVAILGLPIVLLGLIGAAIFLVIDDLIAMGEGGESVIGGLISEFQRFVDELGSVGAAIREILTTAIVFWFDVSKEQVDAFVDNVMATLGGIWDDIVTLWNADLDEFFQFMFRRFKVIGDFIAGIFGDEENVARIEAVTKAATPGAAAGPAAIGAAAGPAAVGAAIGAGAGVGPLVEPQFPIPGGSSVVLTQEGSNIELNISGAGSPEQVGNVAAVKVDEVLERRQRQAMQQLTTAGSTS